MGYVIGEPLVVLYIQKNVPSMDFVFDITEWNRKSYFMGRK